METLILDFNDATPDDLGEILWSSFIAAQLVRQPELREVTPRPEWSNQDDATKALWGDFARRLVALHRHAIVIID